MTDNSSVRFDRRSILKATGAATAVGGLGAASGIAGAEKRSCPRTAKGAAAGSLEADEKKRFTYTTETDPCVVSLGILGGWRTDVDLYVTLDGRKPTTEDYDDRSTGGGRTESIDVRDDDLSAGDELGILVVNSGNRGPFRIVVFERGEEPSASSQRFTVRIENVADPDTYPADSSTGGAVLVTPGAYAVHGDENPIFQEGSAASPGLAALAEAGRPDGTPEHSPGLVTELSDDEDVVSTGAFTPEDTVQDPNDPTGDVPGAPPIAPGGAYEFEVEADPDSGDSVSFASMFVPSNDLFFAPGEDGISLFDGDGTPRVGDATEDVDLWDAGTEPNQKPGYGDDQAPSQSDPDQGADEGGVVRPIDAVDDGYDYPDPSDVVEVTVRPANRVPFTVRIENVADPDTYPDDSSTGGAVLVTPGVYALHEGDNPIIPTYRGASDGLEALAEAGRPDGTPENSPGLLTELASDDDVRASGAFGPADTVADPNDPMGEVPGAPPIAPGGAFEFTVNAAPGELFTFASMFVPSNDLFFSPDQDAIPLFDDAGNPVGGDVTEYVQLWDAGTEPNQKPGFGDDQAPSQSDPDQGREGSKAVRDVEWVFDGYDYPDVEDTIRVTVEPQTDG